MTYGFTVVVSSSMIDQWICVAPRVKIDMNNMSTLTICDHKLLIQNISWKFRRHFHWKHFQGLRIIFMADCPLQGEIPSLDTGTQQSLGYLCRVPWFSFLAFLQLWGTRLLKDNRRLFVWDNDPPIEVMMWGNADTWVSPPVLSWVSWCPHWYLFCH